MPTPLARTLERLDVTQGALARQTGLTRKTIWDAYHGRPCSAWTWVKIAKALGVPLASIAPDVAEELRGLIVA